MTKEGEQQAFGALLDAALTGRLTRRQIFVRAAALGLSVPTMQVLLSACGATATPTSAPAPVGGTTPTSAAGGGGGAAPAGATPAPTAAAAGGAPTPTRAAGAAGAAGGTPRRGGTLKVG